MKIKLNIFFHILLLDVRFPGEVAEQAKSALMGAMEEIKLVAAKRLQHECTSSLSDRLLNLIQYHELVTSHLDHQKTLLNLP